LRIDNLSAAIDHPRCCCRGGRSGDSIVDGSAHQPALVSCPQSPERCPACPGIRTEAISELLCVRALCETEDVHVDVIAAERMAAGAQRQAFAKEADGQVVGAAAAMGRERDLMRPRAIDRSFAEFAFAKTTPCSTDFLMWSPPALTLLAGAKRGAFAEIAGGVRRVYQMQNKKGTSL